LWVQHTLPSDPRFRRPKALHNTRIYTTRREIRKLMSNRPLRARPMPPPGVYSYVVRVVPFRLGIPERGFLDNSVDQQGTTLTAATGQAVTCNRVIVACRQETSLVNWSTGQPVNRSVMSSMQHPDVISLRLRYVRLFFIFPMRPLFAAYVLHCFSSLSRSTSFQLQQQQQALAQQQQPIASPVVNALVFIAALSPETRFRTFARRTQPITWCVSRGLLYDCYDASSDKLYWRCLFNSSATFIIIYRDAL